MSVFIPDVDGVKRIGSSAEMRQFLLDVANGVAGEVRDLAPRGRDRARRRHYRDTIVASVVKAGDGWVGRVATTDPFGHLVEWGSVKNPAYAPIRRATQGSGLRFNVAAKGSGQP